MRLHLCEPLEARRLLAAISIFSDGFEGPLTGWHIAQSNSSSVQWAVEESGFDGVAAHSGQLMAYVAAEQSGNTPSNQTVPAGTQVDLLHAIDLTSYNNASLSFWYNIPSIGTSGQLQVAVDNGAYPPTSFVLTLSSPTNGWQQAQVDISAFGNESKTLQFLYTGSGGVGAFLDDIEVDTNPAIASDTTPPTAHFVGTLSDLTAQQSAPLTFEVEYADNLAIRMDSISNTNIVVSQAGGNSGDAILQSTTVNSDGSIDATYSYTPPEVQWDGYANGAYTLELQANSILDSSGNAASQGILGSFNVAIPLPYDSSVSPDQINNSTGQVGSQLPQMVFNVYGPNTPAPINYTADIYLAASSTIDVSSPGTLLGQIPFTYSSSSNQITLNPGASGLTVPNNLPPGTYSLGVHINAPSLYPDTNDSNNWAITDTVTVQPALSNPTVVTVMVLYTPQTLNSFGSAGALQQQINTAIATTNTAFTNSDIDVQLQLVYAGQVAYSETGDPTTDLNNLSQGNQGLSVVPGLRTEYGANIVSLWTSSSDDDEIGLAFIAGSASDADLAYNVIVAPQADDFTFAHEVGHNLGAGHAVGDSTGENSDNGLYDYSHGWRFSIDNGDQYHDIMAYPPGTTIPYYSNPNIDYLGQPTGTADANNALTISEDAGNVALYGLPVATISASAPVATTTEGGSTPGQFQVTATIPHSISIPMTWTIPLTYIGTPSQSDYDTPPASVSITIPAGSTSAFADIPITAIDDGIHEPGQESLTVQITSSTQYTIGTATAVIKIVDATLLNPAFPVLGSIAPSSATITRKAAYKIVATGVAAGTEGGKINVVFYLNTSGADVFNSSDKILGTDKSSAGGWVYKGSAKSLTAGTQSIFAVAKDSDNNTSDPVFCTLTITDNPPVIKTFTARVIPNGLNEAAASITAIASDSDGKVTKLVVWVDTNGDGIFDDGEQGFTGSNSVRQLIAVEPVQSYTLSAIAYDNDGVASAVKNLTFGG